MKTAIQTKSLFLTARRGLKPISAIMTLKILEIIKSQIIASHQTLIQKPILQVRGSADKLLIYIDYYDNSLLFMKIYYDKYF